MSDQVLTLSLIEALAAGAILVASHGLLLYAIQATYRYYRERVEDLENHVQEKHRSSICNSVAKNTEIILRATDRIIANTKRLDPDFDLRVARTKVPENTH